MDERLLILGGTFLLVVLSLVLLIAVLVRARRSAREDAYQPAVPLDWPGIETAERPPSETDVFAEGGGLSSVLKAPLRTGEWMPPETTESGPESPSATPPGVPPPPPSAHMPAEPPHSPASPESLPSPVEVAPVSPESARVSPEPSPQPTGPLSAAPEPLPLAPEPLPVVAEPVPAEPVPTAQGRIAAGEPMEPDEGLDSMIEALAAQEADAGTMPAVGVSFEELAESLVPETVAEAPEPPTSQAPAVSRADVPPVPVQSESPAEGPPETDETVERAVPGPSDVPVHAGARMSVDQSSTSARPVVSVSPPRLEPPPRAVISVPPQTPESPVTTPAPAPPSQPNPESAVEVPSPPPPSQPTLEPAVAVPAPTSPPTPAGPEVPEIVLVAPVEMWFGDARVGVKEGTRTHDMFQKYARVLFEEYRRATTGAWRDER